MAKRNGRKARKGVQTAGRGLLDFAGIDTGLKRFAFFRGTPVGRTLRPVAKFFKI